VGPKGGGTRDSSPSPLQDLPYVLAGRRPPRKNFLVTALIPILGDLSELHNPEQPFLNLTDFTASVTLSKISEKSGKPLIVGNATFSGAASDKAKIEVIRTIRNILFTTSRLQKEV
jgi:hypothetical protein